MQRSAKPTVRNHAALLIVLFTALAGTWTWRLWPRVAVTEAEDTVRVEQLQRVTNYLAHAPSEVVKPMLMSLAHISDQRLAVLSEWVEKPRAQQLRELAVQKNLAIETNVRDALMLAWLGQTDKPPLMESYLMIAAAGDRLSDDVKLYALERLAKEAEQHEQPKVALSILERAVKLRGATWETLQQLVEVCRASREYGTAIAAVQGWMRRPSEESRLEEARDLEVSLMLQAKRGDEALSGMLALLQASPPDLLPERVLDRAWVCARAAQQERRLAPWIQKHLGNFPEDRLEWHALLGRSDIDADYRRWLACLTGIVDMEEEGPRGFDLCLRLAACGEKSGIARLCALKIPSGRTKDFEQFIGKSLDRVTMAPDVIEASRGNPVASRVITARLRERPRDRELHFAVALAEAAAKPVEQAAMVWQSFLRHFPDDAAAQRRLVQCHLASRQTAMAKRVLEEMEPARLTEADEKQMAVLRQL